MSIIIYKLYIFWYNKLVFNLNIQTKGLKGEFMKQLKGTTIIGVQKDDKIVIAGVCNLKCDTLIQRRTLS